MPQENLLIVLHFVLVWGSVIVGLVAGFLLPVSRLIAIPLGIVLWFVGFFYNFHLVQSMRAMNRLDHPVSPRRARERIAARTLMNLGIAFGFRSWLTIMVAVILVPMYALAAHRKRRYLDHLHRQRTSEGFPDRSRRR